MGFGKVGAKVQKIKKNKIKLHSYLFSLKKIYQISISQNSKFEKKNWKKIKFNAS